jgi:hypothetical protein
VRTGGHQIHLVPTLFSLQNNFGGTEDADITITRAVFKSAGGKFAADTYKYGTAGYQGHLISTLFS